MLYYLVQWLPRWQQQLNGAVSFVLLKKMSLSVKQLIPDLASVFLLLFGAHQVDVALHYGLLRFIDGSDAAFFKDSVVDLEVFKL